MNLANPDSVKPRRPVFTFMDLFAGIGGMRLAFEAAGGRCVATCEINKYSRQTYLANFPSDEGAFYEDIRSVTCDERLIETIPDHDVLVAGFPCQPFSLAGVSKKNALGTPHGFACEAQGTLFFDIASIIKIKKPKAFLLENVKNLVNHDGGNTFRVILNTLRRELNYEFVDYRVIDAKPFVPQHRERMILVGFKKEAGFSWDNVELPKSGFPTMSAVLHNSKDSPDGQYVLAGPTRVNPKYVLTTHLWKYLQNYAAKHRAAGNGFGYGLVHGGAVARTLSARYYKDGAEILVDRGGKKNPRRLTPRECSRLMGFDRPDGSPFKIVVSDTQAYKQFGNAVVVPVIEAVARAMKPCIVDLKAGHARSELPLFGSLSSKKRQ